jgi:hypothetical protein
LNKPAVEDLLKIKYCLDGEQEARKTPIISDLINICEPTAGEQPETAVKALQGNTGTRITR